MHSPKLRSPVHTPSRGAFAKDESSHTRRKSGLRSRETQLLAIRFGWVVLVIWYEIGEFFSSLSSCKFPDSQLRPLGRRRAPTETAPTHLVLLADPHVPHPRYSYSPNSRPWVNMLRQAMDELFMRKSWHVVTRLGRIDGVIVLGDMLDWGRGIMSDEEYESYYALFASIFKLPTDVPMYYLPGNHDIPLGPNPIFSSKAKDRYAKHFSPPNAVLEVANHSLILLDSVGLVEEDYRRYAGEMQFGEWDGVEGGVIEFIKDLGEDPPKGPKILLSHIPLARPDAATCGPHRERGKISKGAGPGYQNLLGSETSRFLLDALEPSIVFSGDDHDYCDLIHPGGVREVTLKSFSSSAGIDRPGFQLLSLVPPDPSTPYTTQRTFVDRPCFLPDQAGVYWHVYLPFTILTILYLFGSNIRSAWKRWSSSGPPTYGDIKGRTSPNMQSSETMPGSASIRRTAERPTPVSIPSRRSSQHLNGLTAMTPSNGSYMRSRGSMADLRSARSAPVSPSASPRAGYFDVDDERDIETPSISRKSSYIYMHGREEFSQEPSSYFLPLPSADGRNGLGLGTPAPRRPSSSQSGPSPLSTSPNPSSTNLPTMNRRTTMPRVLSAQDWSAAAKAKEKSVLGVMMDSLPVPGVQKRRRGSLKLGYDTIKGFMRALWKARNGVVARSWREVVKVAWPPAVVWVLVNALFFWV